MKVKSVFLIYSELLNKEKMWEQKYIDQQRLYEHSERQVLIEFLINIDTIIIKTILFKTLKAYQKHTLLFQ